MKNHFRWHLCKKAGMFTLALPLMFASPMHVDASTTHKVEVENTKTQSPKIIGVQQINPTSLELIYENNQRLTFDFYGDNIFRVFQDNNGGILRDPEAKPEAQILVDNPRASLNKLNIEESSQEIIITTDKAKLIINKNSGLLKAINLATNTTAFETIEPIHFDKKKVSITLKENKDEYFFGGGVQNGRFSHKGKIIAIENQNSWTDGGVASPTPFYWSTNGYGVMWYTFKKGTYDFGAKEKGLVKLQHETDYLDAFFMINDGAVPLLNDFYQLTGNPVLLPKFGFYQGHLNAYNRDYWKESEKEDKGILFEDGKRYIENQKDNGGIKESLNGEKGNYQFSARAVIDRYKNHDMPFGWLLPNDGYGAGYGQEETLDGNIRNLKNLADYAHQNGVEIGLWTQSDLHPKEGVSALLQRDIVKEVRDAGVRVLKTDVAWVGAGYSFGLNGIADVSNIMTYYGSNSRPFIISLDGWAGTQRYAGIWSGDQTGGVWEYIRFHIPTYLGSGLSGQPNITSDMDGIFGGKNLVVNTRDFQWKTFTPMQLNMDGWGSNEKYPHALGEPATSINRMYLKMKSEIMPYAYSIAKEAVDGKPMIKAMFLDYPNTYTLGKATQYQFLYGPYFLVAPIYQETKIDEKGNDIRNGIYLPEGSWIDYLTGDLYEGNCILNNFDAPLWKLPVFVKNGAIIPLTNPNNNVSEIDKTLRIYEVYPHNHTFFTEYDDDGATEEYRLGKGTTTQIEANTDNKGNATIIVHPTEGDFTGFSANKSTEFRINVTEQPKKVVITINNKKVKLDEVSSLEEFKNSKNAIFYQEKTNLNQFATPGSEFENVEIIKNPQLLVKVESLDITTNEIKVDIKGFTFNPTDKLRVSTGSLEAPQVVLEDENIEAYTITPTWNRVENADFYEVELDGMLYSTITETELLFENLEAETNYSFKIRSVNKDGHSDWANFDVQTKANPLEFAIPEIVGETSAKNQGGYGIHKLFDYDESSMWHTAWSGKAIPFDIIIDLKTINKLDKFHYLPRTDGANGTLLEGKVYYSNDKESWTAVDDFTWERDGEIKIFAFENQPTARFIKLEISKAVGDFGSGRELYVFKVPHTESYIPGDINNDRLIDRNDLTSYTNYTGLRMGDADFEGYISKGDINQNDLIDAYDISVAATQLDGGIENFRVDKVSGSLSLKSDKQEYKQGETVSITVKGIDLKSVNALSFAIPYSQKEFEFIGVEPLNMKEMENLTNDRLHTNGVKSLYPTFVNVGEKEAIEGSQDLFILKFKAKQNIKFNLKAIDGFLVDRNLNTVKF